MGSENPAVDRTGRFIPVGAPCMSELEERYVVEAIRSSWISSSGEYLDRFEAEFAALCQSERALAVCNGTVALHLALLALDVRPGDEILVPSLTYVATANAVRYMGAEPVFIDVCPETWTLNPDLIERSITRRTKGIIPVHLYGHPADMDEIRHLAGVHGLWVVEDAAEAPFARYKGQRVGSLATMATFSFYGNKVLSSGEGGAVTVSDSQLYLRLRTLRGQGVDPRRRYFFPVTGYNFRLTNVAAAILCAQVERSTELLSKRREIYQRYDAGLAGVAGIGKQPCADWAEISPWLYSVTIETETYGMTRDQLAARLASMGIETRPFFIPLHLLPPFREESRSRGEMLPVSEDLGARGMNLPTYPDLHRDDVDYIISCIRKLGR